MRVPVRGASCLGVGRPGSGALPPRLLVLSGVRPGPTTHWLWVRGLRRWGPVSNPTARALASWLCALWGRHEGARGGAPLVWVWCVRGRALSHPPPIVPSGLRPGPASHWPWVRCAGSGPQLSLAPAPVPPFVVCCARFPGSHHPMAIVALHCHKITPVCHYLTLFW